MSDWSEQRRTELWEKIADLKSRVDDLEGSLLRRVSPPRYKLATKLELQVTLDYLSRTLGLVQEVLEFAAYDEPDRNVDRHGPDCTGG